jgi:Glucodextranase, domain B
MASVGHRNGHVGRDVWGGLCRCRSAMTAFLIAMTMATALAADITLFGPEKFIRQAGRPVKVTRAFAVIQPAPGHAVLRIVNDGATGAIWINGQQVLGPADFNRSAAAGSRLERRVRLVAGPNEIAVELRGRPGTSLTAEIVAVADGGADTTPPVITGTVTPPANANGWHNADATVTFACTDAQSAIATCPAAVIVSTEGAAQVVTGTATDAAGNSATTTVTLNVDKTAPVVSTVQAPAPNANGWNNTPVVVTFAAADALSGVVDGSLSPPVEISSDGANQSATGQATDRAGNVGTATQTGIKIDRTVPTITVALSPAPNASGWASTPVTARFTCSDGGSGIAECPPDQLFAADGVGLMATGTTVDAAGNSAAATSASFKVDQTKPTITVSLTPASSDWIDSPVTAHFTCSDTGSGVESCPPDRIVSTEGDNQTVTGTVTDHAGNTDSVTSEAFKIDLGPPAITVALTPPPNANGWANTPVTAHFTCTDTGSGVAQCPPDQIFNTDGSSLTASGTATDAAGNSASVTSAPFQLDRTAPIITVSLSPTPSGWLDSPVTAHFTCIDAGAGIESCPADVTVNTEGADQTVTGAATDLAGNTASVTSDAFSIDLSPPTIQVTTTPPANANGWHTTDVTLHYVCSDSGAGVETCPPDQVITTEGAAQTITRTVVDRAGKTAVAQAIVNIDLSPPTLAFGAAPNNGIIFTSEIALTGTAEDAVSGIGALLCNGAPATVSGSAFECAVALTAGDNSVEAVATDAAGHIATATISVTHTRMPHVTITSPADLSYLGITPTTISGTVDDPTVATVTINSIVTPVTGGNFSMPLPLAEGPNTVTVTAASSAGALASATVTVTLDTTPPRVTITSPADQFTTADDSISVAGIVNDIVVGTVNDEQARVSVKSVPAAVANRTFLASTVPLVPGVNIIQAVATDKVGNAATTEITVIRQALGHKSIDLVSGNNQSGVIRSVLSQPLVVSLADTSGGSVANKTVIFKVTQNDGAIATAGDAAPTVTAVTDSQGRAQAQWTLGGRAGAGGNVVEAYAVGFDGTAVFTATGRPGAAAQGKVVIDTGNDQIGAITEPLPKPFLAVVVDEGNNRLAAVPVTFAVRQGGGSFKTASGDAQELTVVSDSDGRVAATLTLGLQEGNANNLVEATFEGNAGGPAAFTASGRAPGNPANTAISGVVLDNSNNPIPGVTVRAVLTNVLRSNLAAVQAATAIQTDGQGQFSIPQAPVGAVKLLVDGTTAQLEGEYPSLEYDIVTVTGQDNTVGQPIYLLPLNTDSDHKLCVTATTGGGTLTLPEAPGFSLTFAPGQVTFPGGSKTGCVSVTVVNGDKVPMVPGFGQQPRFIVTIQPAGAVFNPPAPITLPNVDGLQPRAVTEMYSFDHDIGSFVAIGTGIVSDDGQVIRSSPGVGVLKAGWHCGGDPAANGTVADCPTCQSCKANKCQPDDTNKPKEKCASCKDGKVVPPKTSDQCCAEKRPGDAAGYVVCCNAAKTACNDPSQLSGSGQGKTIKIACVMAHERKHFDHTVCPTGANECTTTGPLGPKPGQNHADAECEGYRAEVACLQSSNCSGNATCQALVDGRIALAKGYANGIKPGCFP